MSSHREAPEIAKDPVADSTDLYAFVSPDAPNTVTLIANYIPLQEPAGGPNFYEFGDDVLYMIRIDNDGDSQSDIDLEFRFTTQVQTPGSFLYNTGPIDSLTSPNWNRRQVYSVNRVDDPSGAHRITPLGSGLTCPPCNVGVRSTPNYASLATQAVHTLPGGIKVFAGQRAEGFFVDLGSIFDLGALRPFQNLHLIPLPAAPGVNATKFLNVHSIAIQIPKRMLTKNGTNPTDKTSSRSVIGVWTTALRQKVRVRDDNGHTTSTGPFVRLSRLGNPLVNEVLVPLGGKDFWNSQPPHLDSQFDGGVTKPELAGLLPVLYPGVFPKLAALNASGKPRADLLAILHTGIPNGIVPGFQNFTGPVHADLLRLNMSIPPAASPKNLGVIAGDLAGFPNGRRVFDDVVTVELRAIAGATYPLVDSTFTPDGAAAIIQDGTSPGGEAPLLNHFPYLGTPWDGFHVPAA